MPDTPQITFGDNVRVRLTPETEVSGHAGLVGQVYGGTTPSVTRVKVIGELMRDCAVAVHFNDRNESVWFAEQLIEFVDHAPGTIVGGAATKWVRSATGEWCQIQVEATAADVQRDNRRVKLIIGIVAAIFIIILLFTIIRRL